MHLKDQPQGFKHILEDKRTHENQISKSDEKYRKELFKKLKDSVENGNVSFVEQILRQYTLTNKNRKQEYVDSEGNGLIATATCNNHSKIVQVLVKYGHDINMKNKQGNTPLHLAIINNSLDVAHTLINNGADEKIINNNGLTPWQMNFNETWR